MIKIGEMRVLSYVCPGMPLYFLAWQPARFEPHVEPIESKTPNIDGWVEKNRSKSVEISPACVPRKAVRVPAMPR